MKVKDFLKLFEDCHPEEQVIIDVDTLNVRVTPCGIFRRSMPGQPNIKVVIEALFSDYRACSE